MLMTYPVNETTEPDLSNRQDDDLGSVSDAVIAAFGAPQPWGLLVG